MRTSSVEQGINQRQPLLAEQPHQDDKLASPARLPWLPVLILAIWRATHAVYFGYMLTWITRFIILNKLADQTSVGRIAGWIESAYALGILIGLAPASYLSDNWGRKSTAISGIICASVGTVLFGFASTVPQLVSLRLTIGFFVAFLPATILTSLIELATPETMAFAFTINTVAWRFGTLIAPFIGGLLAEPATYYPNLFKDTVWDRYPYALSGVGAASIPLLSIALGLFIVPETLREDRKRSIWSILRGLTAARDTTRNSTANVEPLGGLFTKPVCFMLSLWALYVFMQMACYVAEVLFLSSSTAVGGLDLIPREMAILYVTRPLASACVNFLCYPALARRYSPEEIFRWGVTFNNTTFYASYLVFGLYAATHRVPHGIVLGILLTLSIPMGLNGSTATACTQTLSSRAPSKAYLSRMITAQEYVANFGLGLGSLAGSNAWAFGVTYGLLHGQAVWLFVLLLAVLLASLSTRLTKQKSSLDSEDEEEVVPAR